MDPNPVDDCRPGQAIGKVQGTDTLEVRALHPVLQAFCSKLGLESPAVYHSHSLASAALDAKRLLDVHPA